MSSEPKAAEQSTSKPRTWLKAILGTAAGLCSGAVMMYISPLVDKVIKPAKPLANFEVQHDGLTVTLLNRSSQGDGWWDFGDGSSLEPISGQGSVAHTYANPGTYTAKLTLRNYVGEESERSVTLQLESAHSETPELLALDVTPVSAGAYAPATFKVSTKTRNAKVLVWDFDDDSGRPLEFETNSPNSQDRLVTFAKPGGYTIKLGAVNGEQTANKTAIVFVDEPPRGTVTAILSVIDQAIRVEKVETPHTFTEVFTAAGKATSQPINRQIPARQGYTIVDARMEQAGKGAKDLRLEIADDKRSVRLVGELIKDPASGPFQRSATPPNLTIKVKLVQEKRTQVDRPATPVTATLNAPGSAVLTLPPLPTDWVNVSRQIHLELRDGDRVIAQESRLPRNLPVAFPNRICTVTGTQIGDQVRVDLTEVKPGQPAAN